MNNKKIIPFSFAALSVAGALSACSDTAVVGADVQDNSVALSSSSVIEPGSSSSLNRLYFLREEGAVAALTSVSRGTAVTYSHIAGEAGYQTDSVTAHESFDRAVQSILNIDPTVRLVDVNPNDPTVLYATIYPDDPEDFEKNHTTYVAMKDEDGSIHGDISFRDSYKAAVGLGKDVSCGITYVDIEGNYVQMSFEDYRKIYYDNSHYLGFATRYEVYFREKAHLMREDLTVIKYFESADSTVREEFRKDCTLENGKIVDNDATRMTCMAKKAELKDGVETYTDPYWKKYATYIIESCVTPQNIDEFVR